MILSGVVAADYYYPTYLASLCFCFASAMRFSMILGSSSGEIIREESKGLAEDLVSLSVAERKRLFVSISLSPSHPFSNDEAPAETHIQSLDLAS